MPKESLNKILIIGGEGYIGTVLSYHLLQSGYSVKSLDLLLYQNHHCVLNHLGNKKYYFIYGDMVDKKLLKEAIKDVDAVILLAGLVGDPITKKYPEESVAINEKAVQTVIDVCDKKDIKRLILVSTCSNYGLIEGDYLAGEEYDLNPLSLYAKSKVNAEKYVQLLKGKTRMNPTILRFATAFGLSPRMRFDLTVNEFTRELAVGNELLVYDAHTWRPYCHVRDFARLIQIVIEAPEDKVSFEVFNGGGDVNNTTKQMLVDNILQKIPHGRVRYQEHGCDPRNYRVSFNKVKEILGFEPKYTIQDGIDELIDAINNHLFDYMDENQNFYGNYEIHYSVNS